MEELIAACVFTKYKAAAGWANIAAADGFVIERDLLARCAWGFDMVTMGTDSVLLAESAATTVAAMKDVTGKRSA